MEGKRKKPTKKAALFGDRTAGKEQQSRSYIKLTQLSSGNLKEQIGLLLWLLCSPINHQQKSSGWQLFGILLSQLYQINAQNTRQGCSTPPESKNSG